MVIFWVTDNFLKSNWCKMEMKAYIGRMIRLARTSADIDKEEKIRLQDIRKVLDCRDLDKSNSKMLVVK